MENKETLSVILSNLQKAAEKQQHFNEAADYGRLSEKYDSGKSAVVSPAELKSMISGDIPEYASLQSDAEALGDRGILRALKWGQKVTAIQKSLLDRYDSKGEALLEGKELFLCEACGFIFLGDAAPDICPVCKAPVSRFSKI